MLERVPCEIWLHIAKWTSAIQIYRALCCVNKFLREMAIAVIQSADIDWRVMSRNYILPERVLLHVYDKCYMSVQMLRNDRFTDAMPDAALTPFAVHPLYVYAFPDKEVLRRLKSIDLIHFVFDPMFSTRKRYAEIVDGARCAQFIEIDGQLWPRTLTWERVDVLNTVWLCKDITMPLRLWSDDPLLPRLYPLRYNGIGEWIASRLCRRRHIPDIVLWARMSDEEVDFILDPKFSRCVSNDAQYIFAGRCATEMPPDARYGYFHVLDSRDLCGVHMALIKMLGGG